MERSEFSARNYGECLRPSVLGATEPSPVCSRTEHASTAKSQPGKEAAMTITEAVARAAIEDILDIIEKGNYFLSLGRLANAIKTIIGYFGDQLEGEYNSTSMPVDVDVALKALEDAKAGLQSCGFGAEAKEADATLDPATIIVIINVAVALLKLWRSLKK